MCDLKEQKNIDIKALDDAFSCLRCLNTKYANCDREDKITELAALMYYDLLIYIG